MNNTPNYKAMVKAINDCHRIDEGESISDPMEALKYYARIAQNLDFERKVIEIRRRAERGARRLMREVGPEELKRLMQKK